jgi:hypothetical protein
VVGGQMSGVEIAGTIATHLSSAANSPGPSCIPEPGSYSVHHVIQRPVWVFPLHTSPNVCSPPALGDVITYLLTDHDSRRRQHPLSCRWTFPPTTSATGLHR